jgi:hypothetical protein
MIEPIREDEENSIDLKMNEEEVKGTEEGKKMREVEGT